MRKVLTAGIAALIAAGSFGATAAPALAQGYHAWHGGYHRGWHRGWRGGWGWGVGLGALALGAALAAPHYYDDDDDYYYGSGYYGSGYYGSGYYGCAHRVWDPYEGVWTIRYYC